MIYELQFDEYRKIWPLVQELAEFNLIIKTVIEGNSPGRILVDNIDNPRTVYMDTPEGSFIAGHSENTMFNASLRVEIPYSIDLRIYPDDWESIIGKIIRNKVVVKHLRRYYLFKGQKLADWKHSIPAGYEFRRIDEEILRKELNNLEQVTAWIEKNWHSTEDFLEKGFGFCLIHVETIVSLCMSDCVSGDRCEIGVWTDPGYRGRGFATLVVAGTVDYCLSNGLSKIGWHCLDTNIGSIRIAEKVGFSRTKDYYAFSSELPAGNASDLDRETWVKWAEYYEGFSELDNLFRYRAAESWALAGETTRSMKILNYLIDIGWLNSDLVHLLYSWPFEEVRNKKGWVELIMRLRRKRM